MFETKTNVRRDVPSSQSWIEIIMVGPQIGSVYEFCRPNGVGRQMKRCEVLRISGKELDLRLGDFGNLEQKWKLPVLYVDYTRKVLRLQEVRKQVAVSRDAIQWAKEEKRRLEFFAALGIEEGQMCFPGIGPQ